MYISVVGCFAILPSTQKVSQVQTALEPEILELHLWWHGLLWRGGQCSLHLADDLEKGFDLYRLVSGYHADVHCGSGPWSRVFEQPCAAWNKHLVSDIFSVFSNFHPSQNYEELQAEIFWRRVSIPPNASKTILSMLENSPFIDKCPIISTFHFEGFFLFRACHVWWPQFSGDLNSQELVRGFVSSFLPHQADLAAVVCGSQVPLGSDFGEGLSLWCL